MTLNFVLSRNSYEARHLPELDQGDGSFPRHIELVKLVKTHVDEDGYIRFDSSQLDIYIQLMLQAITLYHPTTFQPNLNTNMRAVSVIGVLATIISKVRFSGKYCLRGKIDGNSWYNCCRQFLPEGDGACPW
ncbi:hypothetical protein BFJ71_g14101 [Fusarium oxysporum]|nr:hypothetical protein BFJ71_g14101 [Fusarium oxysporum]